MMMSQTTKTPLKQRESYEDGKDQQSSWRENMLQIKLTHSHSQANVHKLTLLSLNNNISFKTSRFHFPIAQSGRLRNLFESRCCMIARSGVGRMRV